MLLKFLPGPDEDPSVQAQRSSLKKTIQSVIDIYGDDLSRENVLTSITNLAWGILSRSPWDQAVQKLVPHARVVISNHFSTLEEESSQKKRAEALSQFVLRYLITQKCRDAGKSYRMIDDVYWERERLDDISFDEIIERSIYGDGTRLGQHQLRELLHLIKVEIHQIESRLKHDEPMRICEQVVAVSGQPDLADLCYSEFTALKEEYREVLERVDYLKNSTSKSYMGDNDSLRQILFELRLLKQVYDNVYYLLNGLCDQRPKPEKAVLFQLLRFSVFRLNSWESKLDQLEADVDGILWHGTAMFMSGSSLALARSEGREVDQGVRELQNRIHREKKSFQWIDALTFENCEKTADELREALDSLLGLVREINELEIKVEKLRLSKQKEIKRQPSPVITKSFLKSSIDDLMYRSLAEGYDQDR